MERRDSRRLAAAVVLLTLGLAPAVAELPSDRVTWRSLDTPNFKIIGEVSASRLVEAADRLEGFRAALARLSPATAAPPAMPVTVVIFYKDRDFWPYSLPENGKPDDYVGYFHSTSWGNYMLLVADSSRNDPYELLYSGYSYQVLASGFSRLPAWFRSGLSEYYRTFHMTAKTFEIGRPSRYHLQTMRQGWKIPLQRLIGLDESSAEIAGTVAGESYYAESWALVHYLLNGDRDLAPRVPDLLQRLGRGESSATALPAALGISIDELDRQLTLYAQKSLFRYVSYSRADLPTAEDGVPATLPRSEMLEILGEYLAHEGQADRAREHLLAAEQAGGDSGDIEAALGFLAEKAGNAEDASTRYDKALQLPVHRVASYVHVVRFDLAHPDLAGKDENGGGPQLARALEASKRATELDPQCGEAWSLRGLLELRRGDNAEAMAALAQAQILLPGRSDIAYNRFAAALNAGQLTIAKGIATTTLARIDPEEARRALSALAERQQNDLLNQAMNDANQALGEQHFDDALEILRSASAKLPDGDAKKVVEQRLQQLVPYVAERKLVDRYQLASKLTQQGKYTQARVEIRGVLADCTGQRVCKSAQELLDYLDRRLGRKR